MSKNPEIIVLTLADRLAESYRVFFIPPRPDKSVVEIQVMQKHEFIEQRRLALEKYLCRLAAHPVIRKSIELRLFLQAQGKLPLPSTTDMASRMLDGAVKLPRQLFGEGNAACSAQAVAQQAKGGRDLVRMFKELRQSVTIDWGGVKPLFVEEEKEFLEKKEKLQDLEHELTDASQQVCKEAFIVWMRSPLPFYLSPVLVEIDRKQIIHLNSLDFWRHFMVIIAS